MSLFLRWARLYLWSLFDFALHVSQLHSGRDLTLSGSGHKTLYVRARGKQWMGQCVSKRSARVALGPHRYCDALVDNEAGHSLNLDRQLFL